MARRFLRGCVRGESDEILQPFESARAQFFEIRGGLGHVAHETGQLFAELRLFTHLRPAHYATIRNGESVALKNLNHERAGREKIEA